METDLNAQGQDGAASPEQNDQQNSGVQKRIDELVGMQKAAEERYSQSLAARDEQIAQLTNALIVNQSRQIAPQQEPQVEVDPAFMQQFNAVAKPIFSRYESELQVAKNTIAQMRYQQVAAQYPDEVQKMAGGLMQQWQREGKTGWSMEDALVFAAYRQGVPPPSMKPQPQRNANGQFSSSLNEQGAPPAPPPQRGQPKNYDNLPLDQRLAAMEADGVGDSLL